MPLTMIPSADRAAIYANLREYAYCVDRSDGPGIAATFTRDGVLEVGTDVFHGRDAIEAWGSDLVNMPGFAGRQHHVQPLILEPAGDGYTLTSYFMIVIWRSGEPPFVHALGYYEDHISREDGEWRFKRKAIKAWRPGDPATVR